MGSPAGSPYSVSVEQMITTMFTDGCKMRAGRWPTPSTDRSDHNGTAEIGEVIPTLRRKQVS